MDRHNTWRSISDVAAETGVTVRTIRYYDQIDLVSPTHRDTWTGARGYSEADLLRLGEVVLFRKLGFTIAEVRQLLAADDRAPLLRARRDAVAQEQRDLSQVATQLDNALERTMNNKTATPEDMRDIFGDGFDEDLQAEVENRWGDTAAWEQSAKRTAKYTKADWVTIKSEADSLNEKFAKALDADLPANSPEAMNAAEAHRQHITTWFFDTSYDIHRNLGEMYVGGAKFTKYYDDLAPGLAQYVRDAIHANADRHDTTE